MTDNLTPAAPARFYGFAQERTIAENLAALSGLPGQRQLEPGKSDAGESAASTSTELVHAPRNERAPSAAVQAVIEALIGQPPPDQQKRKPRRPRRKPAGKRRRPVRNEPRVSSRAMHEAHCSICGTDCQEEIDEEFVDWHPVGQIAEEYQIDRRAVYRHAHATGLFPKRDRNLRRALGLIIHRAEYVDGVTADSVIRAVRTLAHINETGEWVNPPAQVVFSTVPRRTDEVRSPEQSRGTPSSSPELLDTPCQAIESVKP